MKRNEEASRLRQQLLQDTERLSGLMQMILQRSGLLKGSFYNRSRQCGKEKCRCRRGEPHQAKALMIQQQGRRCFIPLAGMDVDRIEQLVGQWRRFRKTRAEIIHCFNRLVKSVDRLGRVQQVEIGQLGRAGGHL